VHGKWKNQCSRPKLVRPEAKPRVIENAKKRIISNVINRAPIVTNETFSISLITTHNLLSACVYAPGL
jgi:hypothetical protein